MNKNNPDLAINGGRPVSGENIIIHKPCLDEDDFKAVESALRSTFVSGDGPCCREFEKKMSELLGVKHALFVNSATSALEIAFRVRNFKQGSEVIIPDFTYTSSALGPMYNNLNIKIVDVYRDNGSIDVSRIESAISEKTVAIVPVDYAGIPADMDSINSIAKKYGLYVVHDTAQSIGSVYKGRMTGTLADVSTFSFHGTKNITTGEGGMLITNDDAIASSARIIREKGTDKYNFLTNNITRGFYQYVDIGNSYVQSNLLGALGLSQLSKLHKITNRRKEIAEFYLEQFKDIDEIDFLRITDGSVPNWHLFAILVPPDEKFWIMDALRAEGIMANIHYSPIHTNKLYKGLASDSEMTGAIDFYNRLLRLPLYPNLTEEELLKIATAVKKIFINY